MTLIGFDLNASRLRAVQGPPQNVPMILPLPGERDELPLALSLEERTPQIGPGGAMVLSYLKSCRRETISGIGTVIVGSDASKVHLSDVKDETIACDADHAHATVRETSEAAATIVRGLAALPAPQVTLYGASPIFGAAGRGTLVLERLDEPGERQKIEIGGNQIKGRFFDFAGSNRQLTPGGTYLARFKETAIVFRIDPQAKGGATPMLGRLLQMD